jgi:hypothetical protein
VRTIWTVLSVLAVANLLGLLAFVGWLKSTDRLDMARVREVREAFAPTLAEQRLKEAEAKAKEDAAASAAAELAKSKVPPVAAADALEVKLDQSKADLERTEALRRDVEILRDMLKRERMQLESEWAELKSKQAEFKAAREAVAQTEGNAQFKKALATYEGLKADKCKAALQQLIDQKQIGQVVAYLNAMQERTRTKVIDEFIKSDPKVATDLLERLRTRGQLASGPEEPTG